MKKWHLFTITAALLSFGSGVVLAEEAKSCPRGRAVFGKLSCMGVTDTEPVLDAYFFGATSLREIQAAFPERVMKLGARCKKKIGARQIAMAPANAAIELESVRFKVEPVETCLGKRGYQQPCVQDEDCLEHFCHPERGTCSAVFTVPISAAQ